ncbi:hypothetical protein FS837_011413 [Tulasnella sp. UAMH 9824]|nr:hypothetical protein FS837_011413 [Tulasnella sp. UAMH 9824]
MDAPTSQSEDSSHEDRLQSSDGIGGSLTAEIAPYDSPRDTFSSVSPRPTGEDVDADDERSDSERDHVPSSFSHYEAQEPTVRHYHPEASVLPTTAPDEVGGSNSTRMINDSQVDDGDSDGPPGLATVSRGTDSGEESEDDLNSDDQIMPELEPINFYSNSASETNTSRTHGTTSQNNMALNEPTQSEAARGSISRNASSGLGGLDTGANRSMFPDRFEAFMGEVYRALSGLRGSATTTSNRPQEIIEKMHVLDREELRRFQNLVMLQADNEEDRVRGASCSVCCEVLIIEDEQKESSLGGEKGKGKEHDSRSSMESDGSGSSGTHQEDTRRIVALPCTHVFHSTCLVPWFARSATCPECRFDLDPSRRIVAASNPVRPRIRMSRDIYDLYNRPRRNGDQAGLLASTSAGRSRSLPRDGSNDLVADSHAEQQVHSNPVTQPAGTFPVENMSSSRETSGPAESQGTAIVEATAHQETTSETLNGRTAENTEMGSNQSPLDPLSLAQQEEGPPLNTHHEISNSVIDVASRSPVEHSATPNDEAPEALSHVSERLSGIRDSLHGVQNRMRRLENRLDGVEGRLRNMDGRSGVRSNALDSTRVLSNRQDVGLFNVGSREEAIRRLRSLAAEDSSTSRSSPASVNLPTSSVQITADGHFNERRSQMRNENSPRLTSEIDQSLIPTASSSTTTQEPIADPPVMMRPSEAAPTTTASNAPARPNDRARTSIPGEGDSRQGSSMSSTASPLDTEEGDEDTAILEQEIRELEEQLEEDRLYVQLGDNALQQLSGMMNNLSRVLREAALQEQVFSQAIDALQDRGQGRPTGSPDLGITSRETEIDPRMLEGIASMAPILVPSDDVVHQALSQDTLHPRDYVPPPGRMTFEEMLEFKEKEQGLRCPGICGKLVEEGGCTCPTEERDAKVERSE